MPARRFATGSKNRFTWRPTRPPSRKGSLSRTGPYILFLSRISFQDFRLPPYTSCACPIPSRFVCPVGLCFCIIAVFVRERALHRFPCLVLAAPVCSSFAFVCVSFSINHRPVLFGFSFSVSMLGLYRAVCFCILYRAYIPPRFFFCFRFLLTLGRLVRLCSAVSYFSFRPFFPCFGVHSLRVLVGLFVAAQSVLRLPFVPLSPKVRLD